MPLICSKCGATRPDDGPLACPVCLLAAGLEAPSAVAASLLASFGQYHLVGVLGEGGMGIVYLAEQLEPVRRRVALKVMKQTSSAQFLARFESERQALALMEHPNIAGFYDAGIQPGGQPYFVMEYVPGLPITDYCDREGGHWR